MDLRRIVLFIHLVAAVVWVGGILFLAMIVPFLRRLNVPSSAPVVRAMGRRFRDISWIAVAVLVVTGIGNLYFLNAFQGLMRFFSAHAILIWKLAGVGAMIAVKFLHDFYIGPRAAEISPDIGFESRWWQAARFLGNANVVLGLIVLYLAMLLVAG